MVDLKGGVYRGGPLLLAFLGFMQVSRFLWVLICWLRQVEPRPKRFRPDLQEELAALRAVAPQDRSDDGRVSAGQPSDEDAALGFASALPFLLVAGGWWFPRRTRALGGSVAGSVAGSVVGSIESVAGSVAPHRVVRPSAHF